MSDFDALERFLAEVMLIDRHRLRQRLRQLRQAAKAGKPFNKNLAQLRRDVARSQELRQRREQNVPRREYDPQLPITAHREEIIAALREHQVLVVCGETGSGKSTQLPKICLDAGRGINGFIGHTQPRRLAARSVAARLAEELGSHVGGHVGFKIRFTDATRPETYVKLMTDGILLAETQHDRFLDAYDTLIIDEAHERSLNIDFLLGYIKRLLPKRPELRLIVTSATIDAARFAEHFGTPDRPAPVIEVSGRTYPVEVRYRPPEDEEGGEPEMGQAIAGALDELRREGPGDVLVFLPTEREIRDVAKQLRGHFTGRAGKTEILPLYARLSNAEQNKVFQPHGHNRVVPATNVAESSLTVPGIRYVIDTGTARISRYAPRSKVQRLPIEAVAQASADQRSGRCGRIGPGIAIRLYSEDDYLARDRYATPEIRRTNLASVILQTLSLKLGPLEEFPFLDPPRADAIRDGYKTLFELGAIDEEHKLTDIGRRLSRLPVDPRIGRMILAGNDETCLAEVLIIAAALEIQDPRERPVEQQQAADEAHAKFAHETSDFFSYLQLWDFYHHLKETLSRNQLRKACRQNFLSFNRMREWSDVQRQLRQLVEQSGLKVQRRRDEYAPVHRALLTGLLSNVAMLGQKHDYQGAGGTGFFLWPGSNLFEKKPRWVIAAELVETTRRYLRTVGKIEPEWIEPLAGHMVKRSYRDPHWSRKQGTALAYEKVSLLGLPVSSDRRVNYGPVDPATARAIFIDRGLVEGELKTREAFFQHNQRLIEELQTLGAKARNREFFFGETAIRDFYEQHVPDDVYDRATLEAWLRKERQRNPQALFMQQADLVGDAAGDVAAEAFPDSLSVDGLNLAVNYRFEPGEAADGITLVVPQEGLSHLSEERLGWLVPGLLETKVTALIRSLPKSQRRNLVPAPDVAREAVKRLNYGEGAFLPAVASALSRLSGERVQASDFDQARLPEHLRMNVCVVDQAGATVTQGRDLAALRDEVGIDASAGLEVPSEEWHRDGLTSWECGELPERVEVRRGDFLVVAYPALVDQQQAVGLRLIDQPDAAARQHREGVRRLFCFSEKKLLRQQVAWLPDLNRMELYYAGMSPRRQLIDELRDLIAELALPGKLPRDEEAFQAMCREAKQRVPAAVQDVAKLLPRMFEAYHRARLAVDACSAGSLEAAQADMQTQLAGLTEEGFLTSAPWEWLQQYPRYFEAVISRVDKLKSGGGGRDRQGLGQLGPYLDLYADRLADHRSRGILDPELTLFRWMLEEFRVSLFAQELGTAVKVSPQRLEKQWNKVRE